jgi:flagellar biosynthesis chaperone FliJ
MNAIAYINKIGEMYGDTCPTAGFEKVIALPYEDVSQLFEEYKRSRDECNELPSQIAAISTFRKAFESQKHIRLLGCKGK